MRTDYYERLIVTRQNEDNLFNNRLQVLLVSTAFLIGAYAQFSLTDRRGFLIRTLLCVSGLAASSIFRAILGRSSVSIKWCVDEISRVEGELHVAGERAFLNRRYVAGTAVHRIPDLLGVWIPNGVILLWLLLLAACFGHWWSISLSLLVGGLSSLGIVHLLSRRRQLWRPSPTAPPDNDEKRASAS